MTQLLTRHNKRFERTRNQQAPMIRRPARRSTATLSRFARVKTHAPATRELRLGFRQLLRATWSSPPSWATPAP